MQSFNFISEWVEFNAPPDNFRTILVPEISFDNTYNHPSSQPPTQLVQLDTTEPHLQEELKIGQNLINLWQKLGGILFLTHGVVVTTNASSYALPQFVWLSAGLLKNRWFHVHKICQGSIAWDKKQLSTLWGDLDPNLDKEPFSHFLRCMLISCIITRCHYSVILRSALWIVWRH